MIPTHTRLTLDDLEALLTLDDLEALAFHYGGTIERNVADDTYRLVGALVAGRRVDFGPVRRQREFAGEWQRVAD